MRTIPETTVVNGIYYPETDGEPMASNTQQAEVMMTLKGNLELLFADRDDVFVAMDLFWYPVEGDTATRVAPDVMVVFGRPKGQRGAYLQFVEDNIPPQVVFEVVSPGNTSTELIRKRDFYEQYGVEEYYVYDPDTSRWEGWLRRGERLEPIEAMEGWVSPRLGVRFGRGRGEVVELYGPDGRRFRSYVELGRSAWEAERRYREAQRRAEQARLQWERERLRAEQERQRAEQERQRAERLAQRLRELGIDPDTE